MYTKDRRASAGKSPAELPAPVLEEGMITSDEPGYYAENEFGIRHENLVVCKKLKKHLTASL